MRKKTGWQPQKDRWKWRKFLTSQEADFIKLSDAALADLEKQRKGYNRKYGSRRATIVNRAIHRAKYDASKKAPAL